MVNDTVSKVERDRSFAPKMYMTYSSDSLYVAFDLPAHARPLIRWDFDGDGRWFGSGNTTMEINVENGNFTQFQTWDAKDEVRRLDEQINDKKEGVGNGLWDDSDSYLAEMGGRALYPNSVNMRVVQTEPGAHIEMAIPKNDRINLMLESGNEIGFHVDYTNVFDDNLGAKTFDWWSYAYVQLTDKSATDVESSNSEMVREFNLEQNYPNPFNPTTTIKYSLPQSEDVTLKVYNMVGREVATLIDSRKSAGVHKATFDAGNLAGGVYFYKLQAGSHKEVRKMTLIK